MFADEVKVKVKAGDGGNGAVSFLHEKYREYGGPDGGDGGKGGDVIFQADDGLNTLFWFKTHQVLKAEEGENGKKRKRRGKSGEDLIVKVPVGTIVSFEDGEEIFDLDTKEARTVIAKGGEGGFGNAHFTSSVRQAPKVAEIGIKGEEKEFILKLKLVADVGLVGLPNAGKSTFLSVVTKATPKIADYPFTTIVPNLGVVEGFGLKKGSGFVIADIPGLIEGASEGKGLGVEFLKHVERTRVILHLVDINSDDYKVDFKTINKELKQYNPLIAEKPQIIIVTKKDTVDETQFDKKIKELKKYLKNQKEVNLLNLEPFVISAVTHEGLKEVILEAKKAINALNKKRPDEKEEYKIFTLEDVKKDIFSVLKEGDHFVIKGKKIEKFALKTDFQNAHSVHRLRDILKKTGIEKELRRKGAKEGDKIKIADKELAFKE